MSSSTAPQDHVAEYRTIHITPISADDIKDVKLFSKMDVYVQASISGYPRSTQTSSVDKSGGTHPRWNKNSRPMELVLDEPSLTRPGLSIRFTIKARSSLGPDKDVGYVTVPIHELFAGSQQQERVVDYQVLTPSGKPKGSLKFAYRFGDKYQMQQQHQPQPKVGSDEPVTAYPAYPPNQTGGGYQQQSYPQQGYPPYAGYPPQSGYGYPPPPQAAGYGYGYPPQPPKRNNRMGMGSGMGLGLGAGLLGGLLVGDMISDASDYADGYGDAMDDMDMGGFDF